MTTPTNQASRTAPFWPLLCCLLLWILVIWQAKNHWGDVSYYNFGWFVPPLAAWLFWRNFRTLQLPNPGSVLPLWIIGAFTVVLMTPMFALGQISPYWRIPLWSQALLASAYTLACAHFLYGRRGLIAAAFPLFFLCAMIPWPFRIETMIVQGLTAIVMDITVTWLQAMGYAVVLAGRMMLWQDVQIAVDNACSGIRSIQALFMVSLFLGSVFGQGWWRRILVIALLPLVVIFINAIRATFLSVQVILNGEVAYDKWHDPAGYIAFGVSMVIIYGIIELLNLGAGSDDKTAASSSAAPPRAHLLSYLPARFNMAALAMLLPPVLVAGTTEAWFRYHELKNPIRHQWTFAVPQDTSLEFRETPVAESIRTGLHFSYGSRFVYRAPASDVRGEIYFYGYGNENKIASVSSYAHTPTICMEFVGAQLVEAYEPLSVPINDFTVRFEHYLFTWPQTGVYTHVFWVLWENRDMSIDPEDLHSLNYHIQLLQLLRGRRDFSRQALLVSVLGMRSEGQARTFALEQLSEWIQPR